MLSPVCTPTGSKFSHGAYRYGGTGAVAHDLKLYLLPAEDVALDEDLVYGRGVQAALCDYLHLLFRVRHAAAAAAEGEGGTDDNGVAHGARGIHGLGERIGRAGGDGRLIDGLHCVLEELPVLALEYGVYVCAYKTHIVALQETALIELHCEVKPGLAAEPGEQAVRLLLFDYALHRARGQRLDVHSCGHVGVGHNGRGVGVYEHRFHAFSHERAAGLGARVVELCGLAYDNGAGAYHKHFLYAVVLRHCIHLRA